MIIAHRAPTPEPEDDPLPDEELPPEEEEDPAPHPDPITDTSDRHLEAATFRSA